MKLKKQLGLFAGLTLVFLTFFTILYARSRDNTLLSLLMFTPAQRTDRQPSDSGYPFSVFTAAAKAQRPPIWLELGCRRF